MGGWWWGGGGGGEAQIEAERLRPMNRDTEDETTEEGIKRSSGCGKRKTMVK